MRRSRSIARLLLAACLSTAAIAPSGARAQEKAEAPPAPKLTKPPKLVTFVEATYPEEEKTAGRAASVTLEIALSATGGVAGVKIVASAGAAFDAAAIDAVKRFVFDPAEIDGKPAPVKLTYRYDFVLKEAPKGPVTNLEGVVRDRFTKKPLAGVTITVEGAGEVTTDEEGHFAFQDVPLGKHAVTIAGPGLTTISTEESIEEGKKLDVKYAVEPKEQGEDGEGADLEIVVVAPKLQKEVVSTEIKVEEGRRVPGTQGDTLKVVQNLPGVARAAFGSGALIVWGAAPKDTRVYIDGVRIPSLYHVGGIRSTVNSDIVRSIDLSPGGWGAEYGRGLGGLVQVASRAPRSDGFHGYVAADVIDASAMVEGPIGDRTRAAVAGRKSYLDRTISAVSSDDFSEVVPIPDYFDVQARVVRDLRENETIEAFGLASRDHLVRAVASADPAQTKDEETLSSYWRAIVKYRRDLGDGSSVFVTPSVGGDVQSTMQRFGGASPTELDVESTVFGLRAGYRGRVHPHVVATAGLDVEVTRSAVSRRGAVTAPAREGDVHVFGQQPPDQLNADDWSTTLATLAPYGQLEIALLDDRLHVTAGGRLEPYLTVVSRLTPVKGNTPSIGGQREQTAVEPRLAVRYDVTKALSAKAAFGVYHQSPEPEDLSAVFGNPTLGIASARQWLAGATYRPFETVSIEATGFYATMSGLVARSAQATPILARALEDEGAGSAFGAQVLVRKELAHGLFGWASYALIRAERQDHPDGPTRLFDYDQTHVATVLASYDLGWGFEVGARVRYATGFPRTPVEGAFYDSRRDLYEPYFGKQSTIRVPGFWQGDVRVSKRFELKPFKVEAYLDVQNVTNRENAEDIVYSYDYTKRDYITGLPVLPVFGARAEW